MTTTLYDEELVFFPCDATSLSGVLTVPANPNGRTVLLPWGGGTFPSSGANQFRARLARGLASHGFHSFRFDYLGVGESEGTYRVPDLAAPNCSEILAAAAWLRSRSLDCPIVVGNCFGAWSALLAVSAGLEVEAVGLMHPPVGRDHRDVLEPRQWWMDHAKRVTLAKLRSPVHRAAYRALVRRSVVKVTGKVLRRGQRGRLTQTFSGALEVLLDSSKPVLLIYGEDDKHGPDIEAELGRGLASKFERAGELARIVVVPGRLAGATSFAAQERILEEILGWLRTSDLLDGKFDWASPCES